MATIHFGGGTKLAVSYSAARLHEIFTIQDDEDDDYLHLVKVLVRLEAGDRAGDRAVRVNPAQIAFIADD